MKRLLLVALVLALAAPLATAAPPAVGELLRSVPVTAQVVVAVDSAALRAHPKVQEWLLRQHAWTGADEDLRQFLSDAGLDPFRDVDAMVVAAQGEGAEAGAVALFSGRYDPSSLGAALIKRGAQPFTLAGVSAYRLPSSERHGGEAAVLAQISPDLVVVGEESAVGAAAASPHSVPPLVEKEISAGHIDIRAPFWMVATVPAGVRQKAREAAGHAHGEGSEAVRSVVVASGAVQRVAVQASLDDSLRLSGVAIADTAENAELIRDAVKGAIAAARLHAQSQSPEFVNVLRDVEVRVAGTGVSVFGAVPLALLEKLVTEHKRLCEPSAKRQI
jgi:hypothetical protein